MKPVKTTPNLPGWAVRALKRLNRCYCPELGNDAPCAFCDGPDREPQKPSDWSNSGPPDLLGGRR